MPANEGDSTATYRYYLGAPTSAAGRNRASICPPSKSRQPPAARNPADRRWVLFSKAVTCPWTPYFDDAYALDQAYPESTTSRRKEDDMKKALGFVAGAAFMAALIITCGGNSKAPSNDAGSTPIAADTGTPGSGFSDTSLPGMSSDTGLSLPDFGVGEARAQTQPAATAIWEYAVLDANSYTLYGPQNSSVSLNDAGSCRTVTPSAAQSACMLIAAGALGWELVMANANGNMYFKRSKQ